MSSWSKVAAHGGRVQLAGRGLWRWATALFAASLFWQIAPAVRADMLNRERCAVTHLVLEDCPNLVKATFEDDRKHHWSFQVAGPIALFKKLETYASTPQDVLIRDYATQQSESPKMLLVQDAWFLYDARGDLEFSQKPHIYAFKSKDAALKAQHELAGELLQWDSVKTRAKKAAADWHPTGRHSYNLQGRPGDDE